MKKMITAFFRRGIVSFGFGPLVLAALYLILQRECQLESLTVGEVSTGIFSLCVLAFIAGGMNCIYQLERLPLMLAIAIHGIVLYIAYLLTYLINSWLEWGTIPILAFSGIFIVGYIGIWAVIYLVNRAKTKQINEIIRQKQETEDTL